MVLRGKLFRALLAYDFSPILLARDQYSDQRN